MHTAGLAHVRVWLEGAVVVGDVDTIVSGELAVWKVGVCIDTLLWSLDILVVEIQTVGVEWVLLSGIDLHVSEKSSGSVHGSNKDTAYH